MMLNVRDTDNCKDSADNFIDIVQSAMAVLGKIFHVHAIFSNVIGVHTPILACITYQTRRKWRAALKYLSSRRARDDGHLSFRTC